MRVAGRRLGPRVADADDRPPVELIVRNALVLHPRAVDERVAVVTAEPFGGAKLAFDVVAHFSPRVIAAASPRTGAPPSHRPQAAASVRSGNRAARAAAQSRRCRAR